MSSIVPQDPETQALKKIGERAWTVMMGYVVNGSINSQKMRDFAYSDWRKPCEKDGEKQSDL